MTITDIIFIMGRMFMADIDNYFLPLSFLYLSSTSNPIGHHSLLLNSWKVYNINSPTWIWLYYFSIHLITGHGNINKCPKTVPVFQTYSSLPTLWSSSAVFPWYSGSVILVIIANTFLICWFRGMRSPKMTVTGQWNDFWVSQ